MSHDETPNVLPLGMVSQDSFRWGDEVHGCLHEKENVSPPPLLVADVGANVSQETKTHLLRNQIQFCEFDEKTIVIAMSAAVSLSQNLFAEEDENASSFFEGTCVFLPQFFPQRDDSQCVSRRI